MDPINYYNLDKEDLKNIIHLIDNELNGLNKPNMLSYVHDNLNKLKSKLIKNTT